jgi:U3 small nucleolar RNA-associated protein 24
LSYSKANKDAAAKKEAADKAAETRQVFAAEGFCVRATIPTSLFLSHNEALQPPYRVLVDTNFIHLSVENRIDLVRGMMDCLYAKCETMHSSACLANWPS